MSTPETNLSNPAATADLTPVSGVASLPMLQTMITLIRRELWEHRALWITPLIVSAVLVLSALPIHIGDVSFGVHFDPDDAIGASNRLSLFTMILWGQLIPQLVVMAIVLTFYLLDCLYVERKDRSILFWKSMPVSDATTVLSKLLVATVVVPLGVYLLSIVTGALFLAIWSARVAAGSVPDITVGWDTIAWLKSQALMLYGLIIAMLWFAPFTGFLLLVSAWARRNVFLWSTLPPLIAIIGERIVFGTHYIGHLLEYRSWTGFWQAVFVSVSPDQVGRGHIASLANLFENVPMSKAFLNIDLWLGVAVAAAFVFAAVRIRRYRDDT
jgi:ABC-2 type transport system permease protein